MTTLEKLKKYFNITDTSQDDILNIIIENNENLLTSLHADMSLLFPCCCEEYSTWLKSGTSEYQEAQSTDFSERYSETLRSLIRSLSHVQVL